MKIKSIVSQHRRDMQCVYVCESCGAEEKGPGYDDTHFHGIVVPDMVCASCGKKAVNFRPLATKHADSEVM